MKNAIEKALEGGYDPFGHAKKWGGYGKRIDPHYNAGLGWLIWGTDEAGVETYDVVHQGELLNSPLFWQALGKAMGWGRIKYRQSTPRCIRMMSKPTPNRWKKEWHRFIDHLVAGGDVEGFFNELLK